MTRIGVVRRGYSATGGAESYLKRFARGLVDRGLEVVLFTASDWPASDWPGQKIHRISSQKGPLAFADALDALDPWKHCDFLFSLERVWKCDCYRAGDGVHKAWLHRRAKYEMAVQSWFRTYQSKHRDLLEIEEELFRGSGTSVIANSQMVAQELQDYYAFPADRLTVIYNGYDREGEMGNALPENEEAPFRILFTGSGWERKGLRFAVAAADMLLERGVAVELVVAGRGRKKIAGKSVRYLGAISDMGSVLSGADVFTLPTLYDPFSNACIEALCYGLPVITTTANGFAEIIENGVHGAVVECPKDVSALADALESWCDRTKLDQARLKLERLGAQYSVTANVEHTLEFFAKIS